MLQDADNRYVVFSNNPTEHDGLDNRVAGRGREDQVTQLLDMVVDIQNDRASGEASPNSEILENNPCFSRGTGWGRRCNSEV